MAWMTMRLGNWHRRPWTLDRALLAAGAFGLMSPLLHWACLQHISWRVGPLVFLGLSVAVIALLYRQAWGQWRGLCLPVWLASASATVAWAGCLIGVSWCYWAHICMAGHMEHPPYPAWHYALDLAWPAAMVGTVIGLRHARSSLCIAFAGMTMFVLSHRFLFGSLGGVYVRLPL